MRFSWDGGHDIFGLPLETAVGVPADVAVRYAGTPPQPGASLINAALGLAEPPGAPTLAPDHEKYHSPPPGCLYYDLPQNRLPIALGPGVGAVLVQTPVCPVGYVGIVRYLALVPAVAAAFTFSTRKNAAPVLPFLLAQGAVGAMADPTRIFIEAFPNETIDVFGTNTGGVAQDVLVRMIYWAWPKN